MVASSKVFRKRNVLAALAVCAAVGAGTASGQTAFGSATTIVIPLTANTATFTSTVTIYNPNPADVTVGLNYFDGNDTLTPGAKPCNDIVVPANGSVEFGVPAQCTLDSSGHFGLLVASDLAGTNQIFGYARTQNNANAGFSVEGFPSDNFATDTTNATGLRGSTNPSPPYQSNCFVASLADPVAYVIKLFDGTTAAQIGSDVVGSLNAFEEKRYVDIFGAANGVNAPAATDFSNVRAEFTRTSGGTQQMIGFCTVQDNATFGADFRIAKTLTPPAPPPPPPSVTVAATWDGIVPTLLAGTGIFEFAGATSVTLASTTNVTAYGGGWFGKQSAGLGSADIAICYQDQSGPGPITLLGSATNISITGAQVWHYATGTGSLPAGTYTIGLCGMNTGANSINKNGNSSGFVFTTS